jgi:predicted ATP-dependent serine protease
MKAHAAGRNPHEANWETDISDIAAALEALGGTPATITGDELTARVATLLSQDMPPVKTGIARLDEFLGGGLQAGTLLAIGGETRGDKTTLISTISGNLDDLGVAHLVISLDRTADEFGTMKLARRLGMGLEELRKNGAEAARLTGKLPPQGKGCRLLHAPGISIEEISAEARHQAKQHGARVLMLDTMQLVGGRQGRELEEQHMARVAEGLRSLVQNLRISGIVTVQMDQMGQVWRRAGAIAHTASAFLVLNRDRSQDGAWLENHGNSMGDEADIGTVDSPSLRLNRSGPHFQSE